ncbi:Hypp2149 [Branchiostoma lanceolatum]|uniref:Hypp2149 protein n=1 Tax=Branchiostoma lanceolatum TaxID=7740 RepID=A0A8J9ZS19_BRALA|nr:Hypp2149 [Branchiostoma lanceolatum]
MLKLLASSSRILCEKGLPDLQKLTAAVPAVIARRQHSHTGNGPGAPPVGSPGKEVFSFECKVKILQKLTAAVPSVIARRQHSHAGNGPAAPPMGSPGSQPKIDFTARLLEMRNGQKLVLFSTNLVCYAFMRFTGYAIQTKQTNRPAGPGDVLSEEELQRRLNLLRTLMVSSNIDAALFTSYHNINYYGDFLHTAFGRPYGLVVTMDKVLSISAGTSHPVCPPQVFALT